MVSPDTTAPLSPISSHDYTIETSSAEVTAHSASTPTIVNGTVALVSSPNSGSLPTSPLSPPASDVTPSDAASAARNEHSQESIPSSVDPIRHYTSGAGTDSVITSSQTLDSSLMMNGQVPPLPTAGPVSAPRSYHPSGTNSTMKCTCQ